MSEDLEVVVKQASLNAARLLLVLFAAHFYNRGWMPALHGSSIELGKSRDIDVLLVRTGDGDITDVIKVLESLGMDIRLVEDRGRLRGLVGLLHGYLVDVTVVL